MKNAIRFVTAVVLLSTLSASDVSGKGQLVKVVNKGKDNPQWLDVTVTHNEGNLFNVAVNTKNRKGIAGYDLRLTIRRGEIKGLHIPVKMTKVKPGYSAGMALPKSLLSEASLTLCEHIGAEDGSWGADGGNMYEIDLGSYLPNKTAGDEDAVLAKATIFGFGVRRGQKPDARKTDVAFKSLMSQPDAKKRFVNIFNQGNIYAKCYSICALHHLDKTLCQKLSKELDRNKTVRARNGCVVSEPTVGQIITEIEKGRYDYIFKNIDRKKLSPPVQGISTVVGSPKNQWLYTWPHDLLPDRFEGFRVKSTPVDPAKNNRGCTMQNWGKAVSVANSTVSVAIVCRRDYSMSTRKPWATEESNTAANYRPIAFHDLPSGLAAAPGGANTTMNFVFRMNDIVFDLTAEGASEKLCRSALLDLGEQILKFNMKKTPSQPGHEHGPAEKDTSIAARLAEDFMKTQSDAERYSKRATAVFQEKEGVYIVKFTLLKSSSKNHALVNVDTRNKQCKRIPVK